MSPIAAPPPPAKIRKKSARKPFLVWFSEKPEKRSIQIGVVATILIHLVLIAIAPFLFKAEPPLKGPRHRNQTFNIQLNPQFRPRPKTQQKTIPRVVEANPNAPENKPDHTNNVSDRNQQVAQEKPTPKGHNDMPAISGRKDVQSNQIVDGRLNKPQPPTPPTPETPPKPTPTKATPKREQNPLSGHENDVGKSADGYGTHIAPVTENPQNIEKKIEGQKDAPLVDGPAFNAPVIDPKHPRARPTLDVVARPAIFHDNPFGTTNIGPIALDARWSNYGVYMKRLVEEVQIQWDNILNGSSDRPAPGSIVTVKFVLESSGKIKAIEHVDSSPGTSDFGTSACSSAITLPSPYQPWTDDMIAVLGTEQEMTFEFYYE